MEYVTTMLTTKDRFVTPAVSMIPRFGLGRWLEPFETLGLWIPILDNDSVVQIDVAPRAHEFNYPSTAVAHGEYHNVLLEWQMDDADGTTITDAVRGVILTEQGDPTYAVSAATAGLGNGVTFDGTGDAFDILTSSMPASTLVTTGDFSVEVVFLGTNASIGADDTIVCCRDGDSTATHVGWQMLFDANQYVDFQVDDGTTTVVVEGTTDAADGTIKHVIASMDRSGNGVIYLDGVADVTTAISTVTGSLHNASDDTRFCIGGDAARTGTSCFYGNIYFVRVYNKALSAAEALASYRVMMNQGYPGWVPLADPQDGTYLTIGASTKDPIFFDLTEYMVLKNVVMRARCVTEQVTTPIDLDFVWVPG